jgi:hypothetical protein
LRALFCPSAGEREFVAQDDSNFSAWPESGRIICADLAGNVAHLMDLISANAPGIKMPLNA